MLDIIALAQSSYLKSALSLSRLSYGSFSGLTMLKCLGFHGPALIQNGEDTTALMLQSVTNSENKERHSPGTPHAYFSPSSQLSSRTSPPVRQPFYADAYSELMHPLNLQTNDSLLKMERLPESTQRLSADGRPTIASLGECFDPKCVMVAVDATQKLTLAALRYAQHHVRPGDQLFLLGVLHQIPNPKGWTLQSDRSDDSVSGRSSCQHGSSLEPLLVIMCSGGIQTEGRSHRHEIWRHLENERKRKEEEFESAIGDQEIQKLFISKQVTPEVVIGIGPDRKGVTQAWAEKLEATWVILDKNLKELSYLKEPLNCNILMMKQKDDAKAFPIRVYQDKGISYDQHQDARFYRIT